MGLISEFIFWVMVFVVGSLIVSFIISPSIAVNLKDRISNGLDSIKSSALDFDRDKISIEFSNEELNEFGQLSIFYDCQALEYQEKQYSRVYRENMKNTWKIDSCKSQCAENFMEYNYFSCVDNRLHCFCQK